MSRNFPAKGRLLALGCALLLLLSGCGAALLEREYVTERVHEESSPLTDDFILRADSYDSLVNAILQVVSQRVEHGVIRLYNYSGDVQEELSGACLEVRRNDPLGAYAVEYIKYDFSRIVSYYEVNLYVSYRRSYEQIRNIVSATDSSAVEEVLQATLRDFAPSAALRVGYFEDELPLQEILARAYDATPEAAFGLPDCAILLYPDEGDQRIIEITLQYRDEREILLRRQERVQKAAESMAASLSGETQRENLSELYRQLRQRVRFSPEGDSTVYAAFVTGRADSEGVAMAISLLCRTAGIPCEVIRGTRNGMDWVWNRVTLDGMPLELDAAAALEADAETPNYLAAGGMGSQYGYPEGMEPEVS